MADFLSLLTAIPSLMADFSGSTSDPYEQQKKAAAGNMANISAAMTDTSNPLYKQLYGQYQDQARQNMAQVISQAEGQNRMNATMGRTPLFDPARGGETMFRSLMQGYQGMGQQSDLQTRQALQGALGANNSTGNMFNTAGAGAARAGAANLSGYQGISDLLKTFGSNNSTPQAPATSPMTMMPNSPNSQFLQPGYTQPTTLNYSGWGGY